MIPTTDKKWEIKIVTNRFTGTYYSNIVDKDNATAIGTLRIIAKHERHFKKLDDIKIISVQTRKIDTRFLEEIAYELIKTLDRLSLYEERDPFANDFESDARKYIKRLYGKRGKK